MKFWEDMIRQVGDLTEEQAEQVYKKLCKSGFDFSEATIFDLGIEIKAIMIVGGI